MVDIRKSKLFPFQVDEEVTLRKLFEGILQETELGEISDVLISNPDNNDVLVYNETLMVWENQPLPPQTVGNLDDIGNVTITSVQDGDVLTWDSGTNQWVNEAPTGGGGTPGGSPTELQYNNAGAFGGIAGTAWDGTKLTIPASLQIGPSSAGTKTVVGTDILTVQYDHPTNAGSYSKLEMGRTGSTNTGWRLEAVGDGGSDTAAFVFTSESTAPEFNGNAMWHAGNFDPTTKQNTLVSGTNIKTVNGNSLLGPGDLAISGGPSSTNLTVGWDGGRVNGVDQSLTSGLRFELRATSGLDPQAWTLLPKSGSSGDITVDVRIRPFSSGTFTAITAGSPPSISGGARGTGSATGWTNIGDGDLIEFEITSVSGTVTGATLIVEANIV
jgi:hypothetical protein